MEDDGYEIVAFDPHKKFHAHYLIEPGWSVVLADAQSTAWQLGLDPGRVARFVLNGIEKYDEPPGCMLSLLREAGQHFPPGTALELLEAEDPGTLSSRRVMMRVFSSSGFPLYTRDELAGLLEGAIEHLKDNREDLMARGHPRTRFTRSPWLHVRVSWLYPIKQPDEIRIVQEDGGRALYEYTWGKRDEVVGVDDAGRARIARLIEPYEVAPFVYGLALPDAARMEALRPAVFDLKLEVLGMLARALRAGHAEGLEADCLSRICGALTYEDADLLFRQDGECRNFGSRTKEEIGDDHSTGMPRSVTGGLSNLLELIGHCEIELRSGVHHILKEELLQLTRCADLEGLAALLGPAGYLGALDKAWRPQLDEVLNRAWERHRKGWSYFWQGYETRFTNAFESGFRRTVSLHFSVLPQHADDFGRYVHVVGEHVRVHQEVSGQIPQDLLPRIPGTGKGKKVTAPFDTPHGARWEDVKIRFRDGHSVSVDIQGVKEVLNYVQMGMVDVRSASPTKQWDLLLQLAQGHGLLAWGMPGAQRKNQKRRERLARDLQHFFRIDGDPFRLLEGKEGWQTRFHLEPPP